MKLLLASSDFQFHDIRAAADLFEGHACFTLQDGASSKMDGHVPGGILGGCWSRGVDASLNQHLLLGN